MQDPREDPEPIQILKAWWAVAGPALATVVIPVGFQDGKLELAVPDAAWLKEMESRRVQLIQRLRGERGLRGLRAIECVCHPFPQVEPSALESPSQKEAPELPLEILRAAQGVSDPELAQRWTRLVARLLALSHTGEIER